MVVGERWSQKPKTGTLCFGQRVSGWSQRLKTAVGWSLSPKAVVGRSPSPEMVVGYWKSSLVHVIIYPALYMCKELKHFLTNGKLQSSCAR